DNIRKGLSLNGALELDNFSSVYVISSWNFPRISRMKALAVLVMVILATARHSNAFLCFRQDDASDFRSVTWCTNSCYSMGADVFGFAKVRKGCADAKYEEVCQAAGFLGLSQHACFCNGFLCNSSSVPALFLPLMLIPYLVQNILA
ncbi:hypothetical protein SK128_028485, partial [Halocaridina rubra]